MSNILNFRKETCCGIIFIGNLGEVAIDAKSYKPCHKNKEKTVDIEYLADLELQTLTSKTTAKDTESKVKENQVQAELFSNQNIVMQKTTLISNINERSMNLNIITQ